MRRLCAVVLLLLGLLGGTGRAQPPTVAEPPPLAQRSFTLRGEGLVIEPSLAAVRLSFTGGVEITGKSLSLRARQVDVEIAPTELVSLDALKLPELPSPRDAEGGSDPGQAALELARELDLPEPRFNAGALKRVAATGGITATVGELKLATPQLVSTDGGRSWAATGRTTITRSGKETYRLAADHLLYDTQTGRAAARGNIEARFRQSGQPEAVLRATRLELDSRAGVLTVSEGLSAEYGELKIQSGGARSDTAGSAVALPGETTAQYGELALRGGSLSADLRGQRLTAGGGVDLTGPDGLSLSAGAISAGLRDRTIRATGGVRLTDSLRKVSVDAGEVSVNMATRKLTATGRPTVRYGGSTFTGETITVQQQDGKTVVEVEGEQSARLDVKALTPDAGPPEEAPE